MSKIKLLLVQNDPSAMRAIKAFAEKQEIFEVVSVCHNGPDALACIACGGIDVVVTDVMMKLQKDMELLDYLHVHYPNIATIIVSEHQSFAYAQMALRCRVLDYIVSPVSEAELWQAFERLVDVCVKRRIQYVTQAVQKAVYGEADEGITEMFTLAMVSFVGAQEDIESAKDLWICMEGELRPFNPTLNIFSGRNEWELLILFEYSEACNAPAVKRLYDFLLRVSQVPFALLVHDMPIQLENLLSMRISMRNTMQAYSKMFQPVLISCNCLEPPRATANTTSTLPIKQIVNALFEMDEACFCRYMLQCINSMESDDYTANDCMWVLHRIFDDRRLMAHRNIDGREVAQAFLRSCTHAEKRNQHIKHMATLLLSKQKKSPSKRDARETVEQVEQFLRENFACTINGQSLSKRFRVGHSNLIKMFRRYKNMSPCEFQNQLRIEKAKELLKEQQDMRIREIAAVVGFKDASYFSNVFKQYTGQWPTEFQDRGKGGS